VSPSGSLLVRAAATGSLAEVLAATIATHSQVASCDGYYGQTTNAADGVTTGSGNVGIALVIDAPDDLAIAATSSPAALALFGLAVGDLLTVSTPVVNRRTAGVWRPKFAPPARLEPVYTAIGSGAMSEYNAGTQDRLLFGGRLIWSVVWEYVEAADISRELLNIADYLPLANRATGDTNGTFDDLLYALARGAEVLLALPPRGVSGDAAILYQECVVDNPGNFSRDAYTTEAAVGARRYNVTMAFTETQDYEP
jgi:hypothetical protein